MLTKSQILAACDLKTQAVEIAGTGDSILVRTMSGIDRDQYSDLVRDRTEGASYFNAALIVSTAVDEAGNKLFTPDDIPALRALPGPTTSAIANAAAELNGFGQKAVTPVTEQDVTTEPVTA